MDNCQYLNTDLEKDYILKGLAAMPGGFLIYRADDKKTILYTNHALIKIFECDTKEEFYELTGGTFEGVVYEEDYAVVDESINFQIKNDSNKFDQVTYRIKTKNGKIKYVEDYGKLYDDPIEGPLFYVFVSAIQIKNDALTGLPNMNYFMENANSEQKKMFKRGEKPVTIAFDLMGMKGFNSKYGHDSGDSLLCIVGNLLRKHFGFNNCARFGEDHFYVYSSAHKIEEKLNEFIVDLHEANEGKTLPVKIGICRFDDKQTISTICDHAKIACDSRINAYGSGFSWFDDKMSESYMRKEYILSNVDQALTEEWIHVYYQPVVRTLTGLLCSCEALVRWIDPKLGFISPGEFIPLLEENGLSYKIDMFVIRRVAGMLKRRIKSGKKVVPVSVNISRTDFDFCDPVSVVTEAADEAGIRRSLICIEITETALMEDKGIIRHAIDRFHEAGFDVWMDDFGSGYSSLNVLKNYDFDEIKIDMIFLRDFNERSKEIVTMAVKMAKKLGIHTLAEGVENVEHVEFLKNVGCEKIQGYYYGKPMPIDETIEHIKLNRIELETKEIAAFYDQVGKIDIFNDKSLALFLYDKEKFKIIYENEKFVEQSIDAEIFNFSDMKTYSIENKTQYKNIFTLANKAMKSGIQENMIFVTMNRYFTLSFTQVAECRYGSMLLASIDGTVFRGMPEYSENMDYILRNVLTTYNSIYILDFENDTRTVVTSNLPTERVGDKIHNLKKFYYDYPVRNIEAFDLIRWRDFISHEKLIENLKHRNYITDIFKIKNPDGQYEWNEFLIVALDDSEKEKYIACVRTLIMTERENCEIAKRVLGIDYDSRFESYEGDLWNAFVRDSKIRLFWKNKERRFEGVSPAFLEYYDFPSLASVVGKTDEEVGWHIDDANYYDDEIEVLEKGEVIRNSIGQNIVNGQMRNIAANKFPIYHKNEIIGLMGYFIDIDENKAIVDSIYKRSNIDNATGFMNVHGMIDAIMQMDENYRKNGEDYVFVSLEVPEYDYLKKDYGEHLVKKLVKITSDKTREIFDSTCLISKTYGCKFTICQRNVSISEIEKKMELFTREISEIREIDGVKCSLSLKYGMVKGSESMSVIDILTISQVRKERGHNEGRMINDKNEYYKLEKVYDEIPIPYIIAKPVLTENGENVADVIIEYANKKYCNLVGVNKKDLLGKKYRDIFPYTGHRWKEIFKRALKGEYVHEQAYSGATSHWLDTITVPSSLPGCCISTFSIIDSEKKEKDELTTDRATDEAVIKLAKYLCKEKNYEEAINHVLKKLGEYLNADRVYIFEKQGEALINTFEWCEDGVKPQIKNRQRKNYQDRAVWDSILERDSGINYSDVEEIKTVNSRVYNYLKAKDIACLMVVPMYEDQHTIIGYLGVDNYGNDIRFDAPKLIKGISEFVGSRIYVTNYMLGNFSNTLDESVQNWMADDISIRVAKILDGNVDYDIIMNHVLSELGSQIHSDRINIIEIDQNSFSISFQWCAENIEPTKEMFQDIDYSNYMAAMEKMLLKDTCIVVDELEMLRSDNKIAYLTFKRLGFNSFIASPFYSDGKLIGYIWVDNYDLKEKNLVRNLLETASYFIGAKVSTHRFKKANSYDELTKVLNRNAMLRATEEIEKKSISVGVVYADLNGLKALNDSKGHFAGDSFLQKSATILSQVYGSDNVYRIGGDEFAVLVPYIGEAEFAEKNYRISSILNEPLAPQFALGYEWCKDSSDLKNVMKRVDKKMYENKALYYTKHSKESSSHR